MSTVGSDRDTAVVCHARALKALWDGGPEGRGMVLALESGRGQAEWRVTSEAPRPPQVPLPVVHRRLLVLAPQPGSLNQILVI